jgi:crotonobetainyl-CoA:carnitine CoA-transferase CaiB-like acyl-CoA transferase
MAEGPGKQAMGYILGKAEGKGELWHGHVTAVTVGGGWCSVSARGVDHPAEASAATADFVGGMYRCVRLF